MMWRGSRPSAMRIEAKVCLSLCGVTPPGRVLAAVGEQLVGALEHGLEHALVDGVLVAPAAARRRKEQVVEAASMAGLVLGEDVVKHWQDVDRAQPRRRLGATDLEAAAGEIDVADERVADLVIARPSEHERRDECVAARSARRGRRIQPARRVSSATI
jgi:hypothetical protein